MEVLLSTKEEELGQRVYVWCEGVRSSSLRVLPISRNTDTLLGFASWLIHIFFSFFFRDSVENVQQL